MKFKSDKIIPTPVKKPDPGIIPPKKPDKPEKPLEPTGPKKPLHGKARDHFPGFSIEPYLIAVIPAKCYLHDCRSLSYFFTSIVGYMKIISNHTKPNHGDAIARLLHKADEVILCVAFLKRSGLRRIISKLPENCICYIGTDYYLTEPAALRQFMAKGMTVYLTKKARATFHPKVHYSRHGEELSILVGSANLTGGGLATNLELSILLSAKRGDKLDKDFRLVISHYAKRSTRLLREAQLSQYASDFAAYHKKYKKADQKFRAEVANRQRLDLENIQVFF